LSDTIKGKIRKDLVACMLNYTQDMTDLTINATNFSELVTFGE